MEPRTGLSRKRCIGPTGVCQLRRWRCRGEEETASILKLIVSNNGPVKNSATWHVILDAPGNDPSCNFRGTEFNMQIFLKN